MYKSKKKKVRPPYDPIRTQAVKWSAEQNQVTEGYVRNILSGLRSGGRTKDIERDFHRKYEELKKVLS